MRMSDSHRKIMIEKFNLTYDEVFGIEKFINDMNMKTAKEILDALIEDDNLNVKQKVIVSYIIGGMVSDVTHETAQKSTDNTSLSTSSKQQKPPISPQPPWSFGG